MAVRPAAVLAPVAAQASFLGYGEIYAMLRILSTTEFQRAADLAWDAQIGFVLRVL